MQTVLEVLAIASALAGAMLILWPTGGEVPSITVNHRDAVPTYLSGSKRDKHELVGSSLSLQPCSRR